MAKPFTCYLLVAVVKSLLPALQEDRTREDSLASKKRRSIGYFLLLDDGGEAKYFE
jgi:hypothetical protein